MTTTIQYCISVMKGIYSNTPCKLGEAANFDEYDKDTQNSQKWRHAVRRSWNGLLRKDETTNVFAKDTAQLDALDKIFVMHFSGLENFFMTGRDTWKDAL